MEKDTPEKLLGDVDGILVPGGFGSRGIEGKINAIRFARENKVPFLGICLGNQIVALAANGNTYKLKYGHRSQNQPCIDTNTGRCYITSQNHGYAVQQKSLSKEWREWFYNANDKTNEGLIHKSGLIRTVQFHPEAAPGPVDTRFIFDDFMEIVRKHQ